MGYSAGSGTAINITVNGSAAAERDIGGVGNAMKRAGDRTQSLSQEFSKFLGPAAALTAGMVVLKQALHVQREADGMNASLVTATGSVENAGIAMKALKAFASSTPYSLADVTKAFIQMRNLGLDPSERALRSYGNTAAAMGKPLNQLVEAVADAATGEFERLKEFGIKAKQQGEKVAFTFQGTTTVVGNNTKAIEGYLQRLGDVQFGGGMELRAQTLDGAISNLGDTWDNTLLKMSQSGGSEIARGAVVALTGALDDLSAMFDAAAAAATREGEAVDGAGILHKALTTVFETVMVLGVNVKYVLTQIGNEIGGLAAQAAAVAQGDFARAGMIGDEMKVQAAAARREVDAQSAAILGASEKARKAAAEEKAAKDAAGRDDLARFGIKQTAAQKAAEAQQKLAEEAAKAQKKFDEVYRGIMASTADRIATMSQELTLGSKLSEGQKSAIKVLDDLRTGELKLSDAQKVKLAASLEEMLRLEHLTEARAADEKAQQQQTERLKQSTDAVWDRVSAAEAEIEAFGKTAAAMTGLEIARTKSKLSAWELSEAERAALESQLAGLERLRAAQETLAGQQGGSEALKELNEFLDPARAKGFGEALSDALGQAGNAMAGLTTALDNYSVAQAEIAKQRQNARAALASGASTEKAYIAQLSELNKRDAKSRIAAYGDMAGAAKGFFKESSTGYKALHAAEQTFRAFELAMAIETAAKKVFLKQGEVAANATLNTAKVAGEAAASAASTGLAATEASAWGVTAVVKALASLPFPANLAAGAATLAAVLAIGAKVMGSLGGGSGGGKTAEQQQKEQGAGSVFGDVNAKSESISKSLELLEQNSDALIPLNQGMLQALRSIEASMTGLSNLVIRTDGLTSGSNFGVQTGQIDIGKPTDMISSVMTQVTKGLLGPIGGKVASFINNLWGKTKQEVIDSGIRFGGSVRDLQQGAGFDQYASVNTTKSSWFGLKKSTSNTILTQGLSQEISTQFGLIFSNMEKALQEAATGLGIGAAHVTEVLNGLTISTTNLSLKGLSGDELTQAISSVISKATDDMAAAVFPQLDKFRQVGEGYAESVIRLASNSARLDSIFESLGDQFGAVGIDSLAARERLIALAGGIDKLADQAASFAENYLTEEERLAPVRQYVIEQLGAMGLAGVTTRDQFKQVVLGLDATTQKGAEQYAALMALQDAFAVVYPALKATAEVADEAADKLNEATAAEKLRAAATELLAGVDDSFSVLQRVVNREKQLRTEAHQIEMKALQKRIDLQTTSVAKLQSLSQALHSTLDQLQAPSQGLAARQAAQAEIKSALAIAKAGGPLPTADSLKRALSVVSKDASGEFASYVDYMRDFYSTANDLSELGVITDRALSVEQQSLDALLKMKELAEAAYEAEMEQFEKTLEKAQEQIDVLKGIDVSLISVAKAIEQLGTAIKAAQQNSLVSATSAINQAYQSALGRTPEAAGMQFWQNQAANGVSTGAIVDAIKNSPEAKVQSLYQSVLGRQGEAEGVQFWMKALNNGASFDQVRQGFYDSDEYKAKQRVPGFAAGGDHIGGLRLVGEVGPELEVTGPSRIYSTQQLGSMLRGRNDDGLVRELRALREENANLRKMMESHLYAIAKSTRTTADIHDAWDTVGQPETRTSA